MTEVLEAANESLEAVERYEKAYPVLAVLARRVLLARITLLWLTAEPDSLTEHEEGNLSNLVRRLYRIHVNSVVDRGLAHHLHISKSGGTSFSEAARESNCSMYFGLGQPWYLADGAHWVNESAMYSYTGDFKKKAWMKFGVVRRDTDIQNCKQRAQAMVNNGLQYISNEYTLHGGQDDVRAAHLCPQLVNVVTLRNPEKRMVSHIYYIMANLIWPIRRKHPSDPQFFNRLFCGKNTDLWYDAAVPVIDNYVTRSLLGERGFHTPLDGLRDVHVALAQRQLLQFDLVLDLDADPAVDNVRTIMQQGLGWNISLSDLAGRNASTVYERHNFDLDAEDCRAIKLIKELVPRQGPDRQVYRTGRVLSFLDNLLLSMARALGLRPHPDTEMDATADTSADNVRYPCGLMSFAAREWPPAPPMGKKPKASDDDDADQ